MNNYYQLINQISLPKQQLQIQTNPDVINFNLNNNTYINKIKCQTHLTNQNKIEQNIKLYKDQSTQCELFTQDQNTQCSQILEHDPKLIQLVHFINYISIIIQKYLTVQSKITYTNDLLSQMESVDINDFHDFQPRQAISIQQSLSGSSTLMAIVQVNNIVKFQIFLNYLFFYLSITLYMNNCQLIKIRISQIQFLNQLTIKQQMILKFQFNNIQIFQLQQIKVLLLTILEKIIVLLINYLLMKTVLNNNLQDGYQLRQSKLLIAKTFLRIR